MKPTSKPLRQCPECKATEAGMDAPLPDPGPESDQELATLARALAHPARIKVLRILASRSTCICGEIVDELGLAQSTVSQHLKVMKEAGLIQGEVDGPRVCYCLAPQSMHRLKRLVDRL